MTRANLSQTRRGAHELGESSVSGLRDAPWREQKIQAAIATSAVFWFMFQSTTGSKSQFLATYERPGELTDPGLEQAEQIPEGSKHSEHRWVDA